MSQDAAQDITSLLLPQSHQERFSIFRLMTTEIMEALSLFLRRNVEGFSFFMGRSG